MRRKVPVGAIEVGRNDFRQHFSASRGDRLGDAVHDERTLRKLVIDALPARM
jgi:hypothetical protein